jgi:hypothetical protein
VTKKDQIMATFRRETGHGIVWQPRLYYWYYGNGLQNKIPVGYKDDTYMKSFAENFPAYEGSVPEQLKNKTMIDVYRTLDVSPRYADEILGVRLINYTIGDSGGIEVTEKRTGERQRVITMKTPKGTLREVIVQGQHKEFPVKGPEDFAAMEYLLGHTNIHFDERAFRIAEQEFGDDGVVTAMLPRSPVQRLIINYMGLENTIMALHLHKAETESFMDVISDRDDELYRIIGDAPVQIVNFGENIDANLISPKIFSKYHIPYYNKRVDFLHQKGKYCHIHMDGSLKPILPFIKELHFDAIEAPTPGPQGDVSIPDLKQALGEKILIDGIPALLFEKQYGVDELVSATKQLLDLFGDNIILGVSDELPPTGDIERNYVVQDLIAKSYS